MYLGMMASHRNWGLMQEQGWRKGPWTAEEDGLLIEYIRIHGEGRWNSVARISGLRRNGKSCRLRWVNYLRPELKRGQITPNEESIILELHARWGNRWSTIARSLPGRTDNEIKNYWRTHFKKKFKVPCDAPEKVKTRLLRRQQEQQQQQQQHLQVNQAEVKRVMALLDENDTKMPHQVKQEMNTTTAYTNTTDQEQGCFNALLNGNVSVPEASNYEDNFLWDGLWNLNDVHGNFTTSAEWAKSKAEQFGFPSVKFEQFLL